MPVQTPRALRLWRSDTGSKSIRRTGPARFFLSPHPARHEVTPQTEVYSKRSEFQYQPSPAPALQNRSGTRRALTMWAARPLAAA